MEKKRFITRTGCDHVIAQMSLVELAGFGRVLVENHMGVISYSPEEIVLNVRYGYVQISGKDMMLAEMYREQLVITGQIDAILLHRREQRE